jgi:hypothetical protein
VFFGHGNALRVLERSPNGELFCADCFILNGKIVHQYGKQQ